MDLEIDLSNQRHRLSKASQIKVRIGLDFSGGKDSLPSPFQAETRPELVIKKESKILPKLGCMHFMRTSLM